MSVIISGRVSQTTVDSYYLQWGYWQGIGPCNSSLKIWLILTKSEWVKTMIFFFFNGWKEWCFLFRLEMEDHHAFCEAVTLPLIYDFFYHWPLTFDRVNWVRLTWSSLSSYSFPSTWQASTPPCPTSSHSPDSLVRVVQIVFTVALTPNTQH